LTLHIYHLLIAIKKNPLHTRVVLGGKGFLFECGCFLIVDGFSFHYWWVCWMWNV